jgi:integrase
MGRCELTGKMLTVVAAAAKSGHSRHIPLNAEAISVLEGWRERSKGSGLVFPGAEGKRMTNINRSWRGVAAAAKLKDFKFHGLAPFVRVEPGAGRH